MGHWARIDDNNIVQEVIVIKESELDTGAWGDKSKWIKTSYNTHNGKHYVPKEHQDWSEESADQSKAIRYRFANIGYTYDADNDVFIPPKPADYMIFNKTTWDWDHPVAYQVTDCVTDGMRMYISLIIQRVGFLICQRKLVIVGLGIQALLLMTHQLIIQQI